jgi:dextranase
MNPAGSSGWTAHLLDEYAEVLEKTRFDGIHIDTYGAPLVGQDGNGSRVEFAEAFPAFINATANLVHARREQGAVIFNAVRNLLTSSVAAAQQDAVYIEVWEPYRRFTDLHRIVVRAQELGTQELRPKPVIIAAYIHPEWSFNVRLANALIFASGGYHLELGEPEAMLADPYFPKFGKMDEQTSEITRRYYDFLVRYENILALDTRDATAQRAQALTIEGLVTESYRSKDRVVVIVRSGEGFETFSLVNLIGIDGEHWEMPLTQPPQPLENLTVHLRVTRPVSKVYAASPDGERPELSPVSFTATDNDIQFTVSRLDYWNLLLVEYVS